MQHNYRANPNPGNPNIPGHAGDYANPLDTPVQLALPFPDNTFKSYDVPSDASITNLLPPTERGYSPDGPG